MLIKSAVRHGPVPMKVTANPDLADTQALHLLPRWVTSAPGQGTDSVALSSSAALALRDGVFRNPGGPLPGALLHGSPLR